jgi:hypothetical protein
MADSARLVDLATVLRSKNAGPFELTLDILFDDEASYRRVKDSGVINRERIAELYRVSPETISHIVFFDLALGIKITMSRPIDSGAIGDSDVYGAQQHAPLLEVRIPGGQ